MSLASHTENNNTTDKEQTNNALQEQYSSSFDKTTQHGLQTTTEPTYIHQLSIELVAHIFARLDPTSLTAVAKTCRYWRHIVTDDVCWKNAFLAYFGQLPYKRIRNTSWKAEYILRTHLVRKWEKGRGRLLTFNPKIGSIDNLFVDFDNSFMMAASKEQGVAVKCNPITGKTERHLLYSTDEGMPTQVSALKMDSNRVLWGFSPGYITMITRAKTLMRRQLKVFSDFHQGAVRVLCLPSFAPDVALSAGDDGMVKVWNTSTGLSMTGLYGSTSTPTCLEATADHHVIAGYTNGTLVLWDIQLVKLLRQRRHMDLQQQRQLGNHQQNEADEVETARQRRLIHPPLIDKETPVQSVHYDTTTQTLLVAYDTLSRLYQYDLHSGRLLAVFGGDANQPSEGHTLGAICAVTWDIEPSFTFTDEGVLDLRTTMNNNNSNKTSGKSRNGQSRQGSWNTTCSSPPTEFRRLVATGDTSGMLCLWPLDHHKPQDNAEALVIHPLRQFYGHESPISVIQLDAFKMVSGADDGWIRMWDPLTGELLHALGNKIPRNAPVDRTDVSLMRVKNIFCDEYRGVATIGHQVKSWDFSSQALLGRKMLRPKAKSKAPTPAIRDELHYEIKQEVKASQLTLAEERKEQELAAREHDKWTLGGLSDEEIVAYAMMISQEEPDHNQSSPTSKQTTTTTITTTTTTGSHDYDEDEALLQAVMASLHMSGPMDNSTLHGENNDHQHDHTLGPMDSDLDWPLIGSSNSMTNPTEQDGSSHLDDEDEELQYVLRLSRNEI
ncbi:WD40-repeat-containing domain protein [Chlamydoabsidia padenii]|nr:WD40-repeat-containing domain protein [Chlamydoabsidia padenii]